ncbi:hypothetical protein HG530_002585 [Fusarium avenaceum]|nr:hypothetical protein HG530_002585 [Fusarium avenaceum]
MNFAAYQSLSSRNSAQALSKPFSSTVDFSDPSYDMPYFASAEVLVPKAQNVQKNTATFQHNAKPQAQVRRTFSFQVDYTAFLKSLEFPYGSEFTIEPESQFTDDYKWIGQDASFVKWKTLKTGLLCLRGSEGSGKTTLMKQVIHTRMEDEPDSIHLTYSFPPSGSDLPRTRLGLYKALLRQLISQSPEAFKDIKARFDKIQSSLPQKEQVAWAAQELYDDLVKALPKILKTLSIYIYVDGINYSEGETANKLMQDFSKLIEKAQPTMKEPNPSHGLRIIFSSTAYPAQDPFPRSYIQLDDKNGPNLRKYLEVQLSSIDFNTKQLVASKAGPSFISARLIANHIKLFGPMQSSLIQQPSPTPAPISFLLGAYFQDMKQQGNKSLLSLLNWCCLSSRPLTLSELRVALTLSTVPKMAAIKDITTGELFTRYASDENFASWIKTTSWGLLETTTTPETTVSHLQTSNYSLSTFLIRYLALLTKEPNWESAVHTDPTLQLVKYAGANWSYHISAANLGKPEASKILKLLEWPSDALLKVLIKLGQEDPALGNLQGTWIHLFAVHGHSHLLSIAVKKAGKDVTEAQDIQKRTSLHLAALHAHSSVVKHLLKSGAKTGSRAVNGNTALNFALLQGHQSVLKPLLERDPTLISTVNDLSQTPLFSGAIRGSSSAIKLLLERGADSRALDKFNNSVLHHVATTDKSSILKLLLEGGADINWQNAEKRTPLHIAIAGGQISAAKLLLERGCRADIPDSLGRRALHEAAASGGKSCTQLLLKQKVATEARDNDGQTALVHAVQGRHIGIVKLLLESKADVNVKDKAGFSVLMIAVKACEEKIAKLLLESDQDLNWLSHEGHTVAFYAVLRGKAVSLLSAEEQWIASLLFRRYQKKYPVWNTEWRECQRAFLAEHGKKKDEAIGSKLKSKVKSNEFPSSTQTTKLPKQHKPKKTLKEAGTAANIGVKKASSNTVPGTQDGLKHQQQHTKPATQPTAVAKNQPQVVKQTYPIHTSNSVASKSASGMQERQPPGAHTSAMSTGPQAHEAQKGSSIESFQTTQMSSDYVGRTGMSMGGTVPKTTQVSQSQSATSPGPKGHIVQRNSWDIYSSLSESSTPNQTSQMMKTHSAYATYPSTPQRSSGDSIKPFQPFQPNATQAGSPAASRPSVGQSDSRYFLPSQGSWEHPKAAVTSYSPTPQAVPQTYQPLNAIPQRPVASPYQPYAPCQSPTHQVAGKPTNPQSIGRKPVGGNSATPPMAERPGNQSPFLPWQAPKPPVGAYPAGTSQSKTQSITSTVQAKPAAQAVSQHPSSNKPQAQGSFAQGRPQIATGIYQPVPTQAPTGIAPGKPQVKAGTPQGKAQAPPTTTQPHSNKPQSRISAQGQPQVVSGTPPALPSRPQVSAGKESGKPQAQAGSLQVKPQAQPTATGPFTSKPKAQAQSGTAQGRSRISAGTPQSVTSKPQGQPQAPFKTPQPQSNKPRFQNAMEPGGQNRANTYPAPLHTKPQPSGSFKYQTAAPEQRNPVLTQHVPVFGSVPFSAGAPRQVSYVQNEFSSSEWKPAPAPSHYYESFSSTTQHGGQGPLQTTSSSRDLSESHSSPSNKNEGSSGSKIAAAAGIGIIAGAAGGYLLSSQMDEHHSESNAINNYTSTDYNNMHHQPAAYDSDHQFSDLESTAEESEHSDEVSESEHSDNDNDSEDSSDEDEAISYRELEFTDSDGHISSDDAEDTDVNDSEEDDHEISDSEEDELDSPHMAAGFTDDDASEAGSDDFHVELDSDIGQDEGESSASEGESDAQNDSDEDDATDSDAGNDDGQHLVMQEQYQNQGHFQEQYQPQGHFQEHYEPQSIFQEQHQPQHQPQYQQQVPEQSASEDEEQDDSDGNDEQDVNSEDYVGGNSAVPDYDSDGQVEAVGGQYGGEDWGQGYESDY